MTTQLADEMISIDSSDPSIEKVVEALKNGKKMEAIMICRSTHNVSLAESKRMVDEMEVKLGL
jgi:ribosomal protein L7/L12